MKYRELWYGIFNYPSKVVYYDCEKNEEDVITDFDEMDAFFSENKDREVGTFFIDLECKTLHVDFKKEEKKI